jgi:hypothetical protein
MPISREPLAIPEKFKNNKIFEEASEQSRNDIKVWSNRIPDFKLTKTWIKQNHETIYRWILDSYTNLNTQKEHLRCLLKLLRDIGQDNLADIYYEKWKKVSDAVNEQSGEGKFISKSRLDNFVTFDQLTEAREKYKKLFLQNPDNTKYHLTWLSLALYTLQPALRGEWLNTRFYKGKKKEPPDDLENYIYTKKVGQYDNVMFLRINYDKKTAIEKRKAEEREDEYDAVDIPLEHEVFQKISGSKETAKDAITLSLKHLPDREFVLFSPSNENYPIPEATWRKYMKEALGGQKNVGIDILRSSYINHMVNLRPPLTVNVQKFVAMCQRHSWITAQIEYKKNEYLEIIEDNKPAKQKIIIDEPQEDIVIKERAKPMKVKGVSNFDPLEWSRNYRATEKGKENVKKAVQKYLSNKDNYVAHLRRKVVAYYNNKKVQPREGTIKKYNLQLKNEVWV